MLMVVVLPPQKDQLAFVEKATERKQLKVPCCFL
jgi:hypothetical protein